MLYHLQLQLSLSLYSAKSNLISWTITPIFQDPVNHICFVGYICACKYCLVIEYIVFCVHHFLITELLKANDSPPVTATTITSLPSSSLVPLQSTVIHQAPQHSSTQSQARLSMSLVIKYLVFCKTYMLWDVWTSDVNSVLITTASYSVFALVVPWQY